MRGEFVDVGGTRLYYYAAGTRGGGDPVVLLHGFPGSSLAWRFLAPLMPVGRRLVILDLMGCGRSDGPGPGAETVAAHADLVVRLMDDLNLPRAGMIGHGIGGTIAASITLSKPERVSALGLVSTVAFDAPVRSIGRLARLVSPAAELLGAPMLASFLHGSALRGYADREDGRHSLDQSLFPYKKKLRENSIIAHLRLSRDPAIATLSARLGEIRVPTGVFWGEDDPFFPVSVGEKIKAAIPGATLETIPGVRHFVAEDAPERLSVLLKALLAR
jgi:pimeloyl-ACP methyl ester carboxylesterase